MKRRSKVMVVTVVVWALVVSVLAYHYVASGTRAPLAQGYERLWDWQLFFFAIARLPLWLALLGVVLWMESRLVK